MRGRKPRPFTIAPGDYPVLHLIAGGAHFPAYQVRRARLLLAVAAGQRLSEIAARAGCDASTIWRACRRYETGGLSALLADGRARYNLAGGPKPP
jgi:hypothetical protein